MTQTMADAVPEAAPTLADVVPDRIALADIPSTLHADAVFDPNMGRNRVGYRFSIDGQYRSVEVLVYHDPDDTFPKTTLKRSEATSVGRIGGGRRAKFEWELDGGRLVTMTCPIQTPVTALDKIVVTTVDPS